ncbi:hypothetical protein LJR129_004703 [Acidovorax sp. LjRoot129]|uniref:hypothetical protein n=1 Tax=Acidovorax sp. LjRoot129 TaxID=3342260 RepID=UPI003ECD4501
MTNAQCISGAPVAHAEHGFEFATRHFCVERQGSESAAGFDRYTLMSLALSETRCPTRRTKGAFVSTS